VPRGSLKKGRKKKEKERERKKRERKKKEGERKEEDREGKKIEKGSMDLFGRAPPAAYRVDTSFIVLQQKRYVIWCFRKLFWRQAS